MIFIKLSLSNQILDVSTTEKAGYITVDDSSEFYPFKDWVVPAMCCYRISLDGNQITEYTLAVPDKVFYAVRAAADAARVQAGDDETLLTCYELFGGAA